MATAKIQDYPNLVKTNGAIINTDVDEYVRVKARRAQQKRFTSLEAKVANMDGMLTEILSVLNSIRDNNALNS